MPSLDNMLYQIADILQAPLHEVGKGYKTTFTRQIQVGPWQVPFDVRVKTDVLTKDVVATWVHINANLWMYVISYENGNAAKLIVFDGTIAKLSKGLLQTPCENGDLKATVLRLKNAGGILYEFQDGKWINVPFE